MSPKVKQILAHVPSWPEPDQEELAEAARAIEARRTGRYELDEDEVRAIREGLAQLDRGEALSEEEMQAFWKRCGVL